MKSKPRSRKEKIQLLKDLQESRITIEEITIKDYAIYYQNRENFYSTGGFSRLMTEDEFQLYKQKHPAKFNIIHTYQQGNDPIEGEED